ncbi:MAG: ribosome assembly RNA-binding protein YhbY [Oscillospiraceae bacterium]|jgi:RNA-binding protein|nr:ribosome assembly RNA-binding protein YhbY [Oscillospiraceae bacterium]
MLTSKQRAFLRGIAQRYETIGQVGKGGISENLITTTADALRKRELIKLRVLDNCELSAREAAEALAEATGADVVQVIGSRFVLYKPNPDEPVIELPRAK